MSGLFHLAQFLRFSDVIVACSFLLLNSIQMCAYNRCINSQSTDIWIICRRCLLWIRMLWKLINLSLVICFISLKQRSRTAWSYGKFLFNYFKKLPSGCMDFPFPSEIHVTFSFSVSSSTLAILWRNKVHILWQDRKNWNIKFFFAVSATFLPFRRYHASALTRPP